MLVKGATGVIQLYIILCILKIAEYDVTAYKMMKNESVKLVDTAYYRFI